MRIAARIKPEVLFDLMMLALGIVIVTVSIGYGFGSLARPGPGLYPVFLGVALIISAVVILWSDLRSDIRFPVFNEGAAKTFALMILTFCLWILVMPVLGYVLVTLLAAFAFCKVMKLEGWRKPLAVAGGTALFIFLLFDYWLYIDLPRGFWR